MDAEGFAASGRNALMPRNPLSRRPPGSKTLEFNGIDPDHPFRMALPERGLKHIFSPIHKAIKSERLQPPILVGHNAFFDLALSMPQSKEPASNAIHFTFQYL